MSTQEGFPRARVRTNDDKTTVITTLSAGNYRSVVYTDKEMDALIETIERSRRFPRTAFDVNWDKEGRAE